MNSKSLKLGALALAVSASTAAYAEQIFINSPKNGIAPQKVDAGTATSNFIELGYSGLIATSIYFTDSTGVLKATDVVYDTNINSKLAPLMPAGTYDPLEDATYASYTSIDGNPAHQVILYNPLAEAQSNLDSLNNLPTNGDKEGFAQLYDIYAQYELYGTVADLNAGHPFTSGHYDFYVTASFDVNDPDNYKILQVDITGSEILAANLLIHGTVDQAFLAAAPSTTKNFFNFPGTPPKSFYDTLLAGTPINLLWDTNVDPRNPLDSQFAGFTAAGLYCDQACKAAGNLDHIIRQTSLDGSNKFDRGSVPEPSGIALMGLGLVGMGFRFGRKNKNNISM